MSSSSSSSLSSDSLSPVSWRDLKVAHVSGHEGTTPQELVWIASVPPVIGTACYVLALHTVQTSHRWPYRFVLLLLEVFSFFVPMILCQSVFLYPYGVGYLALMATAIPFLALAVNARRKSRTAKLQASDDSDAENDGYALDSGWVAAMTLYRASLMVLTLIAILAVDFRAFPRRFAKTETAGHSLMDLGAASFVASAGFVSSRARRRRMKRGENDLKATSSVRSGIKWRARFLPVLVIGVVRLVTHRSIDYPEHSTEYGVHWNFMFTLAALYLITQGLFANGRPDVVLPVAIMTLYQLVLDAGLQQWIETAPRTCARSHHVIGNLLVANREGLLGCVGYTCLFLLCEGIAFRHIWNPTSTSSRSSVWSFRLWSIFLMTLSLSLEQWGGVTVSRRSTNAWFLLWVLALNLVVLVAIHGAWERISRQLGTGTGELRMKLPWILSAMNRHGFVVFVVANLLTGAINLSVNTLEVSNLAAMIILLLYMVVNGLLALVLEAILGR
jgi:glucosaminylphosphatidylinositol acyltransferase